jgi:hypothetical protein
MARAMLIPSKEAVQGKEGEKVFEWYDLRILDLYPDEERLLEGPTSPPGVIGEPREEIPDEADLLAEDEQPVAG